MPVEDGHGLGYEVIIVLFRRKQYVAVTAWNITPKTCMGGVSVHGVTSPLSALSVAPFRADFLWANLLGISPYKNPEAYASGL